MKVARSLALLFPITLAACGGGGDQPSTLAGPTFSGTVAIGEPLAGASVLVWDLDGVQTNTVTDAAGRYSVQFIRPPSGRQLYFIETIAPATGVPNAPAAYPRLYSLANRAGGTLNVTPLTTLLVAQLLGKPKVSSSHLVTLATPTDSQISAARQQVAAYLLQRPNRNGGTAADPVNVSAVTDFIGTPFTAAPGNPYDDAIERLAQTFMNGETIEGVEQHMLSRSDPAASLLSILSFEVNATCTVSPGANPALPTGAVRITAGPGGGIAVGSYMRTMGAGDTIQVASNQPGDDLWTFIHTASGDRFELQLSQLSRLSRLTLSRTTAGGGGLTVCTPATIPDLGSRVPSLLPQIRLVAQAILNPSFNCAVGASFPGINNGANTLAIDNNGALRVTAGHALHLPSLRMSMSADIISDAGVLGTRVTSAAFVRTFTGGFDEFGINLFASGAIQRVNLGQQRNNGATSSVICP